jgi:hypothetical protein
MEESLIIEVWDIFKEYIPEKNRDSAADHYVDFLVGKNDVDVSVLEGLTGYDPSLDRAIELVVEENMEEDDEANDWDSSYDDDEE